MVSENLTLYRLLAIRRSLESEVMYDILNIGKRAKSRNYRASMWI